ncbi:MAG: hypothetical protein FJY80_03665 [Candidatus Aminicenantes bacterium]|nr:hypothetical protein [Candidatus Aminicenantes bacterium]
MNNKRTLFGVLAAVASLAGAGKTLAQTPFPGLDPTESARREIRLINLLNGLDLAPEQMTLIRDKAEESRRLTEEARAAAAGKQEELGSILSAIKTCRLENRDVPRDLAQRFHALDAELKAGRRRVEEARRGLAADVEKSLGQHQVHALETFIPCIIPPKGESRVGQAADVKGIAARMERLRAAPGRMYALRRDEIVARSVEEVRAKAGPLADQAAEEDLPGRLGDFFDRVRALSPVDFEVQKEKLAGEFAALVKPKTPALDLAKKVEAFLLSPEVIPLLNDKINAGRQAR